MTPIYVRGASASDANAIIDIDIKCFEAAWSPEEWSDIGQKPGYAISVTTSYGTVVAFAVFRSDKDKNGIEIIKLAVKEHFRRRLISRQLLCAGADYARARYANHIFIIVPESTIYPGPKNIGDWLKAVGFEARNFVKKHFTTYGEQEDGVRFVKQIEKEAP